MLATFIKLPFVFKTVFCLFWSDRIRQILLYTFSVYENNRVQLDSHVSVVFVQAL